jgi:hypothetical protein
MDKKWLHLAVILMFSLVPMVQFASAETTSSSWFDQHLAQYSSGLSNSGLFPSTSTGWSGTSAEGIFPWLPTTRSERTIPTPVPTVVPPDASVAPVYISDLDLTAEYVKLTSQTSETISMTGWKITNAKGKSIRFIDWTNPDGSVFTFSLRPHATVTVYSERTGTITPTRLYWPDEMWDDAGDTAYLYDPDGNLVSSLTR